MVVVVSRLRASGVGRRTIAVRDNPDTAAAYTVSNTRDEAPGLRVRRRAGRPRRRAAGRQRPEHPERPVLHVRRLAGAGLDGRDRWAGLGGRHRAGRDVGDRLAVVLPGQRAGAAAHLQPRSARAAAVLPRRSHPDRLRRPSEAPRADGEAARPGATQAAPGHPGSDG